MSRPPPGPPAPHPPGAAPGGNAPAGTAPDVPDPSAVRDAVWSRVQLARNPRRPHTLELIGHVADTFVELHGDRRFGEDASIVAGIGKIAGRRVIIVGNQKGADTDENIRRNFGMSKPEAIRKAIRHFELAERFAIPVVTFVDTPGAYPGAEAEERGIAQAIAESIQVMTRLRVPIITVITGEGGSGGALAIAVGNVVLALENAVYSVISPEGCASILWRTSEKAADAAVAMKMTAGEQEALGVVDRVIPEPGDGAHTDVPETARRIRAAIVAELDRFAGFSADELVAQRWSRYRDYGAFIDEGTTESAVSAEKPGGDRRHGPDPQGARPGRRRLRRARPRGEGRHGTVATGLRRARRSERDGRGPNDPDGRGSPRRSRGDRADRRRSRARARQDARRGRAR